MTDRFKDMVKVPKEPAAKMLAHTNTRLKTNLESPASALPEVVMEELDRKNAIVDMLRVMAIILPPRERVWWACLAARDLVGPGPDNATPSLAAAEAWVFKPTPENRDEARATLDHAYVDDETVNCAVSVLYADGTLGPGDLANHPAPAGAAEVAAFAMNVVALGEHSDKFEEYGQMLIDRGVNIARGGNGQVEPEHAVEEG